MEHAQKLAALSPVVPHPFSRKTSAFDDEGVNAVDVDRDYQNWPTRVLFLL